MVVSIPVTICEFVGGFLIQPGTTVALCWYQSKPSDEGHSGNLERLGGGTFSDIVTNINTFSSSFLTAISSADQLFLAELVWVQAAGPCGRCHCCFLLSMFLQAS